MHFQSFYFSDKKRFENIKKTGCTAVSTLGRWCISSWILLDFFVTVEIVKHTGNSAILISFQMKFELAHTANCSIQSSSSPARKTPLTTMPVVTTPLVRKSSTLSWTVYVSWLTNVPDSRASSSSIRSAAVLDPVSPPCSWKGSV